MTGSLHHHHQTRLPRHRGQQPLHCPTSRPERPHRLQHGGKAGQIKLEFRQGGVLHYIIWFEATPQTAATRDLMDSGSDAEGEVPGEACTQGSGMYMRLSSDATG
jgi:hypothetical protein